MPDAPVLIVDDNEVLRYVAVRQMTELGLKTEIAVDGKEAIEKYSRGRYCLILMDIMMPGLTGLQATQEIRKIEKERSAAHTPIIALTAFGERADCLAAGMDDYLFKPVKLDELRATVAKWLKSIPRKLENNLLDSADREISKTRKKLDSIADKIAEIKRKYDLG